MNQPIAPLECAECAQSGRAGVAMRILFYDMQWKSVTTIDQHSLYRGIQSTRTERKKVRVAVWACPHGHRHETVVEEKKTS